jgi:hypothetical protein
MVSCEMHSALTSRIYKNGVQTSASGAVSPNSQWSIPMFRAEFLTFALKIVEHSRHLPALSQNMARHCKEPFFLFRQTPQLMRQDILSDAPRNA